MEKAAFSADHKDIAATLKHLGLSIHAPLNAIAMVEMEYLILSCFTTTCSLSQYDLESSPHRLQSGS
eukprot:10227542-Ditylum_brightwellii.AAC.1